MDLPLNFRADEISSTLLTVLTHSVVSFVYYLMQEQAFDGIDKNISY